MKIHDIFQGDLSISGSLGPDLLTFWGLPLQEDTWKCDYRPISALCTEFCISFIRLWAPMSLKTDKDLWR